MTNPNKDGVPEGAIKAALRATGLGVWSEDAAIRMRAALAAALPFLVQPQAGIGVKGLEWQLAHEDSSGYQCYRAKSAMGDYEVYRVRTKSMSVMIGPDRAVRITGLETLDAAKAAAQADYEARINSALSQPLPSPQGEAALEVLRDVVHWAQTKCPAAGDEDTPCSLCGASGPNGMACRAVENVFPPALLQKLRAVIQTKEPGNGK